MPPLSIGSRRETASMEGLSASVVALLQYMLPGFLSAWVFYGFTSHPKPSQFERVVQALIFTFIVQIVSSLVEELLSGWSLWQESLRPATHLLIAFLVGLVAAYSVNTDKLHAVARRLGLTRRTSHVSEWFSTFSEKATYVTLHLKDDRRIYGWPREWPSHPEKGHIRLQQVSWVHGESELHLAGVDTVLIDAHDVRWVEFMEAIEEPSNGS
jgi:hypothetical protein